nr:MAG: ORF1 [TTV-like mini virus]
MPWYWKRRPYWRRRRTRKWGFRPFVRRRLWRRRRRHQYRVRRPRKKLPYLRLKEWQPQFIRKMKVICILPLFITTHSRLSHCMNLYINSVAPQYLPSNGGFSVTKITLQGLYELFQKGRAWWTQSNDDYPLIRYTGCQIKLYKAESSDYTFVYHNCLPMNATLQTFQSCQPNMLQLNKRHITMRCKKWNPYKRPYKKIKIHPPAQYQNKWYFQQQFADAPLLLTMCSVTSLDRWYAASNSISTSIGFSGLNTEFFKYHNFEKETTAGYKPQDNLWLYSFQQGVTPIPPITSIQTKNLIFLGLTTGYSPGTTIKDTPNTGTGGTDWQKRKNTWSTNKGYWGNVFTPLYLTRTGPVLQSHKSPRDIALEESYTENSNLKAEDFSYVNTNFIIKYRYNPYDDKGANNHLYVVSNNDQLINWNEPVDPAYETENLPLWLLTFGFIDWLKLNFKTIPIETQKIIVMHTTYIDPPKNPIVPLDDDFLNGRSPFRPRDNITPADRENWHPKVSFQQQTVNEIAACGPGTVKLPPNVSAEAHMKCIFYFKLGGCAQPQKNIEDPKIQPSFPTPNNFLQKPSLQSPAQAFENFIYNFDWRRDYLTKAATNRIKKYCLTEKTLSEIAGADPFLPTPQEAAPTQDSSESEEEKETLQLLIQQHRAKQQKFRNRILRLLTEESS